MQVERTAQVTHGELTITENLKKIFHNSKWVICQCPFLLETHTILNIRYFRLRHESVLQHVQVRVQTNTAIKLVRSEQSIL